MSGEGAGGAGAGAALVAALVLCAAPPALGATTPEWLKGTHEIAFHTRDGQTLPIGKVTFQPQGERVRFAVRLDPARFRSYFLSMRDFKCIAGPKEAYCRVPYPYANPHTVTAGDLSWLEHALLFLYNVPRDYGARMSNGIYYDMTITADGIVGTPEAIDLNLIAAPPDDPSRPPYDPAERGPPGATSRWIVSLSIR